MKTKKPEPQIHYRREDISVGTTEQSQLDDITRAVCLMVERRRLTVEYIERGDVRDIVNSFSHLQAFVGGCHVAVHLPGKLPGDLGPRVANFTANFGDWL